MSELKSDITLLGGIGMMSTTLLGTGLFMVPAIAASIAGQEILWAWWFLIIAVCPIAITFAALGRRYPHAGGTAYFVKQAFGERLEKAIGLLFISVIPVGIPAAITIAGGFAQQFLPDYLSGSLVTQLLVVILLIIINLIGIKSSSRFQTFIAIGIMALVAAFIWRAEPTNLTLFPSSNPIEHVSNITMAISVMFWCFVGIEAFAHMGEDFKNPERDYPISIIIGCLVAGIVYYLFSTLILEFHAYGSGNVNIMSVPLLTSKLFGSGAIWIISIVGFLACFATINLYTQSLSRMVWSLAREYRPESKLAMISNNGVPKQATLFVGAILVVSCVLGDLLDVDAEAFLTLANSIFVLIYLFAMWSAVKLLKKTAKLVAAIGMVICILVFIFIGISMLYSVCLLGVLWWAIPKLEGVGTTQV
ncbi:L-methionine/branched-chain amino acid transporter [Photobacterium rosenbergii]|uniref:L-methionine/branched-chain amino acid transporter n=1 Tax=Photobacterium rosenbergii TaxID=294936 RepID=A0A2T3NJZ9_9GAMM|nr:L-methionine/branched-chain amino acid transporter [Photobacterium rosenbergii]PSW15800.1 L-methionine/branched-chain amino acid transporter [Photobacterium rosenbergii]